MRKVAKEDFSLQRFEEWNSRIGKDLLDRRMPPHLGMMSHLYEVYRLGQWSYGYIPEQWKEIGAVPRPEEFEDVSYIIRGQGEYMIFHKNHEKFGYNIVETANKFDPYIFSFFDYEMIEVVFKVLDDDEGFVPVIPHVPVYHASIYDRYDYLEGIHEWAKKDPKLHELYDKLSSKRSPV